LSTKTMMAVVVEEVDLEEKVLVVLMLELV
jgi:hypothetical protein